MSTGWEGVETKTKTGRWEQYWRAGYTVGAATPVEVYAFGRSRDDALKRAAAAADPIAKRLGKVGVDLPVVPWVEMWRTQAVTKTQTAPREDLKALLPDVDQDGDFVVIREPAGTVEG